MDTSGIMLTLLRKRRHENGSLTNDVDVGVTAYIVCRELDTEDYAAEQYSM